MGSLQGGPSAARAGRAARGLQASPLAMTLTPASRRMLAERSVLRADWSIVLRKM
jgi:hypothetical protein